MSTLYYTAVVSSLTTSLVPILDSLSPFYGLQWNKEWLADEESSRENENNQDMGTEKLDDSNEDSSPLSAGPMPLETAVQTNPRIAHRVRASPLGLSHDARAAVMRRARETRDARIKASVKRKQQEDTPDESKKKKTQTPLSHQCNESYRTCAVLDSKSLGL